MIRTRKTRLRWINPGAHRRIRMRPPIGLPGGVTLQDRVRELYKWMLLCHRVCGISWELLLRTTHRQRVTLLDAANELNRVRRDEP